MILNTGNNDIRVIPEDGDIIQWDPAARSIMVSKPDGRRLLFDRGELLDNKYYLTMMKTEEDFREIVHLIGALLNMRVVRYNVDNDVVLLQLVRK